MSPSEIFEHLDGAGVTWREYLDSRFKAVEETQTLRATFQERAVTVALTNLERRLDGMNEFRAQLKDQAGTFLTRDASDREHVQFTLRVSTLELWRAGVEGAQTRANLISWLAMFISVVSVIGATVLGIMNYFKP